MKKALLKAFIGILGVSLFSNISYATNSSLFEQIFNGKSEVKISTYQSTNIKKPASLSKESIAVVDKNFKNIKEKLVKYSVSSRIEIYENASLKIDKLIVLRKTQVEKDALKYLNDLVKEEIGKLSEDKEVLEELFGNDENICSTDFVYKNGDCVKKESPSYSSDDESNRRICSISNGFGYQYLENNSWSYCRISQCNEGYTVSNNSCVRGNSSNYYNNGYYCYNGTCNYESRYCSINNGYGKQTWNGNSWSSCYAESCNNGYYISGSSCVRNYNYNNCDGNQHLENGYCVSDTRYCSISNGYGKQLWYGSNWSNCTPESCDIGYYVSGSSCVKDYYNNNCYNDEHYENNSCVSNSRYCSINNGYGRQTWNGNNRSGCYAESCNSGYYVSGSSCKRY